VPVPACINDGYKHSEEGDSGFLANVVISSVIDNGGRRFMFEE
jgi:hypothetical protein